MIFVLTVAYHSCSIHATYATLFVDPYTRYAAGRHQQQRDVADIHSFVRFVLNHGSQSWQKKMSI